jgi:tetratricopeptide (TPR) repeat protein
MVALGIQEFKRLVSLALCLIVGVPLWAEGPPLSYEEGRKFDYFFLDALRAKHRGESTEAFRLLQYVLEMDSTSSAALYEISRYYLLLKKEDLALVALEKAVRYSPDNLEYKLSLASLCRDRGKKAEAIRLYKELIDVHPGDVELYYHLSNLYQQENALEKAIEALNGLEKNLGVNEAVSLHKYRLYQSEGKSKEALEELEALAVKFPTEGKYQILMGVFFQEKKEMDKALEFYRKAGEMDANNPYYFIAMSNYYEAMGKKEEAAQEIERALKNPLLEMEAKLGVLGRYIEGLEVDSVEQHTANALFETLIEQHPQQKELNRMYGQFLLAQGKMEEAKFQLQVVTEALPKDIVAWTQLLDVVVKEGEPDEIVRICNNALIYFSDVPEFYFYKGMACFLKKEYTEALEVYRKGLEITPPENRLLLSTFSGQIADLYYQLDNKEEAFAFYEKALQYNERNVMVLNNYAYYLSLRKEELDKAERMAAAVIKMQPDNPTYLDTYAWIFFQKGNYSLAKFYIESAISKSTQLSGEILEHYGDILYKIGNIEHAVAEWKKALPLKETEGDDTELLKKKIADRMYYE